MWIILVGLLGPCAARAVDVTPVLAVLEPTAAKEAVPPEEVDTLTAAVRGAVMLAATRVKLPVMTREAMAEMGTPELIERRALVLRKDFLAPSISPKRLSRSRIALVCSSERRSLPAIQARSDLKPLRSNRASTVVCIQSPMTLKAS